ncbi:hypothetical protein LCGC14_2435090 [marine sediment metagenome]|uniref:Uncharacterized protein n=1 Tax=marine sediment metagenome TaxID=412755 RepID=A0A0F9EEQ5_9ZZZZ
MKKPTLLRWVLWLLQGKPDVQYDGYHCGICGRWIKSWFLIPTYKSSGEWIDTWGLCPSCAACDEAHMPGECVNCGA